jgi:hypothetical protein
VRGIVEESVKPVKDALARLEQVYALYSEPDADFDKLAAEQGQLEAFLATVDGHNLSASSTSRLTRCACRPGNQGDAALRRRAPPRRALPPAAVETRHAAARRADQPSRRGVGRLAREVPRAVPEHGHLRDARPLLPRQRRRLDPRARSRPRHSRGRATTPPGSSRRSSGSRRRRNSRRACGARWRANSNGCAPIPKARQAKSKARLRQFDELSSSNSRRGTRRTKSTSRRGRGSATS